MRHQLLFDERIPFTSHNGSACLWLESRDGVATSDDLTSLFDELRAGMLSDFIPDSDPGLCLFPSPQRGEGSWNLRKQHPDSILAALIAWGLRCQREIVTQAEARELADRCGVRLEGLGGTNGGVIGALAAIGLTACGDDGRLVQWEEWSDDLTGPTLIEQLAERGIEVRALNANEATNPRPTRAAGRELCSGMADVGKHARPNLREQRPVLFVMSSPPETRRFAEWTALKLK